MRHVVDFVILGVWAAFWIYWAASAVGVKPGEGNWARFALIRVAIVLVALALVRGKAFHGDHATASLWLQIVGLVVLLLGLAVAVWARVRLGRNWGMPMTQKEHPQLITSGPYRWVRHPIYSGLILAMAGTAVAFSWYWLVVAALIGAYFVYSAVREEQYMTRTLPSVYPGYQRATKMLVPFVF